MKNIAQAYIKFQAEVKPIGKTTTVNTKKFSYNYAQLSDIVEAIQPTLSKHNLAFYQKVETTNEMVSVTTSLIHESGETLECGTFSLPITERDPQRMGCLLSYCRRYSLMMIGLTVIDEDNDAVTDSETHITRMRIQKKNSEKNSSLQTQTGMQFKQDDPERLSKARRWMFGKCNELGIDNEQRKEIIRRTTGKDSSTQLTIDEYKVLRRFIMTEYASSS